VETARGRVFQQRRDLVEMFQRVGGDHHDDGQSAEEIESEQPVLRFHHFLRFRLCLAPPFSCFRRWGLVRGAMAGRRGRRVGGLIRPPGDCGRPVLAQAAGPSPGPWAQGLLRLHGRQTMNKTSIFRAPSTVAHFFNRPTSRVASRAITAGAAEADTSTARFCFRWMRNLGAALPHGQ